MLLLETGCWPKERNSQADTYCTYALTPSTSNPSIAQIISSNTTNFSNYLSSAPVFPFPHDGNNYGYDNDLDARNPLTCASTSSAPTRGINLFVATGDDYSLLGVFNLLNDIFDKDEIGASDNVKQRCGKVKFSTNGGINFSLSDTP